MRRAALIACLIAGACLWAAPAALAASGAIGTTAALQGTDVNVPIVPAGAPHVLSPGLSVGPAPAAAVAKTSPQVLAIQRVHHPLQYQVYVYTGVRYEVYFSFRGKFVADVLVSPRGPLRPGVRRGRGIGDRRLADPARAPSVLQLAGSS